MEILTIETTNGRQLRFQPQPSGDVDVVRSDSADQNSIEARIPKSELSRIAEFLAKQAAK